MAGSSSQYGGFVGFHNIVTQLRNSIIPPLVDDDKFRELGCVPKILIHGPEKSGKSMLIETLAIEANVGYFSISPFNFVCEDPEETTSMMEEKFEENVASGVPFMVVIDEIEYLSDTSAKRNVFDVLFRREHGHITAVEELIYTTSNHGRSLAVFTSYLKKIPEGVRIVIIGVSSQYELLDKKTKKIFDFEVDLGEVDEYSRHCMFRYIFSDVKFNPLTDFQCFLDLVPNFGWQDISLLRESVLRLGSTRKMEMLSFNMKELRAHYRSVDNIFEEKWLQMLEPIDDPLHPKLVIEAIEERSTNTHVTHLWE